MNNDFDKIDAISSWIGRHFRSYVNLNPHSRLIMGYVARVYSLAFHRIDLQGDSKMYCFYNDAELHLADAYADRKWRIVISEMEGNFDLVPGLPCVRENCPYSTKCPLDMRVSSRILFYKIDS